MSSLDLAHPDYDRLRRRSGSRFAAEVADLCSDYAAVVAFLAEAWDVDLRTTHYAGQREAFDGSSVRTWRCETPFRTLWAAVFPDGHIEDWTRVESCPTCAGGGTNPDPAAHPHLRPRWLR
jgi:hypothetical protein